MKYERIVKAEFIERENRFVARVKLADDNLRVHVKNTGRCKELLVPGAEVFLEDNIDSMGSRKYRYDLVAVVKDTTLKSADATKSSVSSKGTVLINMDSQAPNKVVKEALESGTLTLEELGNRSSFMEEGQIVQSEFMIRPETVYDTSRFDFFAEAKARSAFIEVKGVTLEDDGVARFPDAPTKRGVRHVNELIKAASEGYEAYIIFVIQMKGVRCFEPNDETDPEFGEALRHANAMGVHIVAYDCKVTADSLVLDKPVPIRLYQEGER